MYNIKENPDIFYIFFVVCTFIGSIIIFLFADEFKPDTSTKYTKEMYDYLSNKDVNKFNQGVVNLGKNAKKAYDDWEADTKFNALNLDNELASFSIISSSLPIIATVFFVLILLSIIFYILYNYFNIIFSLISAPFRAAGAIIIDYITSIFGPDPSTEYSYYLQKYIRQDALPGMLLAICNIENRIIGMMTDLINNVNKIMDFISL